MAVLPFAFLGCLLLQTCGGSSADQLQLCSEYYSPVVGLQYTYDANGTGVFSTTCQRADASSPFSAASPSSVYSISGLVDLTSGCLNNTVVSGLVSPQADREPTGSGEKETGRSGEGVILVASCVRPPVGASLDHCSWARWLGRPGEGVSVPPLPRPWVLRSVLSHFVRRAHRYKLEVCHLTGLPYSPSLTHSCHLPHFPNGTIQGISHTYSISESHSPFRIKINLACDDSYLLKKTFRTAECQNGSWTQLPSCLECVNGVCEGEVTAPVITTSRVMVGFVAGSNLTLDCEVVKGHPKPSLSWHRVLLPSGVRVPLIDHTHFVTHANGSLTILNVSDMDSGPYACLAWNRVGSDLVYTHLYNTHPDGTGPPSIYNWSPLHVVSLPIPHTPTPSHLHCHAHSYPPPIVSWSIFPLSGPFSPLPLPSSSSISPLWNGTLVFDPVRTQDTGIYRCEATNLFGTVSMETILFVDAAPDEAGPVITSANWSTNYTSPVGARLEMFCSASSAHQDSPLTFLWMMKGRVVPMSDSRVWQNGNGTLVFDEILSRDEGPYWCVVWNNGGVAMETTRLIITNSTEESRPPLATDSAPLLHHHYCWSLFVIVSLITLIMS